MTTLRDAAQQALEALEEATSYTSCPTWSPSMTEECEAAAAALRAALAEQPASKPWVGLTEEERTDICDGYGANIHWRAFRAIEAKLQEKNT